MYKKLFISIVIISIMFTVQTQAYEFDFGGKTISFYMGEERFGEPEGEDLHHLEYVKDKYNCEFEFGVKPSDPLRRGVMSGEYTHTVVSLGLLEAEPKELFNYLMPLNDVLEDDYWGGTVPEIFEKVRETTTYGGKYYGFGAGNIVADVRLIMWNKELFEREGLPSLYDLMEEDRWTWDKFLEIAQQATRDTTGDGDIDQWGYKQDIPHNTGTGVHWVYTNNGAIVKEIDGKMKFTLTEPNAIAAMEFYRDLIVETDVVSPDDSTGPGNFADGDVAMYYRNWGHYPPGPEEEDVNFEVGVAFKPLGPEGDDYVATGRSFAFWAIPVTAENPRALIAVTNELFQHTTDYITSEEYREEYMEEISMFVHDMESLDIIEKAIFDKHVVVNFGQWGQQASLDWLSTPVGRLQTRIIASQGETVAEGMKEIEPAFQATLDDVFNQE